MSIAVEDFLKDVYVAYKGKASKVPLESSDKFTSVIALTNRKLREWATNPYHEWDSLWQDVAAGTVVADKQDYDLDDTIQRPSDRVIVTKAGQITKISLIKLVQRHYSEYQTTDFAYLHGNDPVQVTINAPLTTSSNLVGGSIAVPAYILPDPVAKLTDTIIIDNIDWLVNAVAAELARNDPAKVAQFPNLQAIANEFWEQMVSAANQVPADNPDTIPADVVNMGGYC